MTEKITRLSANGLIPPRIVVIKHVRRECGEIEKQERSSPQKGEEKEVGGADNSRLAFESLPTQEGITMPRTSTPFRSDLR
jgi:hypothetical protein